jgi:hypothetical protein
MNERRNLWKHILFHLRRTTMFGSFLRRTGSTSPNHTDPSHPISTDRNSHNASARVMFTYHGHRKYTTVYFAPDHFLRNGLKQNFVRNK